MGETTGSQITNILHMDVGGSLPAMIKKQIGKAQTTSIFDTIKYIKENYEE